MREIRQSGSEGGEAELNRPSLPLSWLPGLSIVLRKDVGFPTAEGLYVTQRYVC